MALRSDRLRGLTNPFKGAIERAVEHGEGGDHDGESKVEGIPNDEVMGVVWIANVTVNTFFWLEYAYRGTFIAKERGISRVRRIGSHVKSSDGL